VHPEGERKVKETAKKKNQKRDGTRAGAKKELVKKFHRENGRRRASKKEGELHVQQQSRNILGDRGKTP